MILSRPLRIGFFLIVACSASATILAQSQSPESGAPPSASDKYFPPGVFGTNQPGNFTGVWYTRTLRALTEPSLFELRADKTVQVYRFLWLPSFHRPISVRLTINSDGSGSIVARSVDKHTGLLNAKKTDSGKLVLDTVGEASKTQVQELSKQLENLGFWSMKTEDDPCCGEDGARWVLEGVKNGEYHIVDRWSPEQLGSGVASSQTYAWLCRYLLQLGKVEVKDLY